VGLFNFNSVTCYFNTVLQCLRATPNLQQALDRDDRLLAADETKTHKEREFCKSVRRGFQKFIHRSRGQFTPSDLRNTLNKKYDMFKSGIQEEADEALNHIVNCLPGLKEKMRYTMIETITADEDEVRQHGYQLKSYSPRVNTAVNTCFKVPLPVNRCEGCDYEREDYTVYTCPECQGIEWRPVEGQRLNLQTLFNTECSVTETNPGGIKLNFEQRNASDGTVREDAPISFVKLTALSNDRQSLPEILVLRPVREIIEGWGGQLREKNHAAVEFGPELIIPHSGVRYRLYATSSHHGEGADRGHWTAHIKNNGQWYYASDETVISTTENVVCGESAFKEACIFFYEKVE